MGVIVDGLEVGGPLGSYCCALLPSLPIEALLLLYA